MDTSSSSGHNFHMPSSGLSNSDSSPVFLHPVQIYCAHCKRARVLRDCYACTECISGFCADCVYLLGSEGNGGCVRCRGRNFKPFQLDFRQ